MTGNRMGSSLSARANSCRNGQNSLSTTRLPNTCNRSSTKHEHIVPAQEAEKIVSEGGEEIGAQCVESGRDERSAGSIPMDLTSRLVALGNDRQFTECEGLLRGLRECLLHSRADVPNASHAAVTIMPPPPPLLPD